MHWVQTHTDNGNQQLTENRTRLYDTMSVKWHRWVRHVPLRHVAPLNLQTQAFGECSVSDPHPMHLTYDPSSKRATSGCWDALQSRALPLFHFEGLEARQMREQLLDPMARELFSLASESPITVDVMRHLFANRTAARFTDLDEVVLQLRQEREIEIRNAGGKVRSRTLTRLQPDDRIAIPETLLLPMPGISRLR